MKTVIVSKNLTGFLKAILASLPWPNFIPLKYKLASNVISMCDQLTIMVKTMSSIIHIFVSTTLLNKCREENAFNCTFMNTTHWCPVYNRHAHVALIDVNT